MKKKIILSLSLLTALFLLPSNAFAYTINNEFNLKFQTKVALK